MVDEVVSRVEKDQSASKSKKKNGMKRFARNTLTHVSSQQHEAANIPNSLLQHFRKYATDSFELSTGH